MLILSEKWITTKCQPPDLPWVADRAAVAPLGPDNPGTSGGDTVGHREVTLYANPFGKMDYDEMSAA